MVIYGSLLDLIGVFCRFMNIHGNLSMCHHTAIDTQGLDYSQEEQSKNHVSEDMKEDSRYPPQRELDNQVNHENNVTSRLSH